MSAGRDVVARVCTTQIDDESSRIIPSTVPTTPVTLARVVGECSPCPSDVIDALEDDLAPHQVEHVEVGNGTLHHTFLATRATWTVLFHPNRQCVGST